MNKQPLAELPQLKQDDVVYFHSLRAGCPYDGNWCNAIIDSPYKIESIGDFNFGVGREKTVTLKGSKAPAGWIPIRLLYILCPELETYSIY